MPESKDRGSRGGRGQRRGGRRTPAGIEKATRTPGAPPRTAPKRGRSIPKPELPDDHEIDLPPGVRRQIDRQAGRASRDVAVALSVASGALEDEDGRAALPYLEWAKDQAGGIAAIREALGVARYLTGDFAGALPELQAYRRISGRSDQNHVLADCYRAVGRDLAAIPALVEAMEQDAPEDRYTEGVIVWASSLADHGDVVAGRAVVERRVRQLETGDPDEQRLRLWYVAADLADRAGDVDAARHFFDRILAVADDFFDTEDRRAVLD